MALDLNDTPYLVKTRSNSFRRGASKTLTIKNLFERVEPRGDEVLQYLRTSRTRLNELKLVATSLSSFKRVCRSLPVLPWNCNSLKWVPTRLYEFQLWLIPWQLPWLVQTSYTSFKRVFLFSHRTWFQHLVSTSLHSLKRVFLSITSCAKL